MNAGTKAVILAAGTSKRLGPLTEHMPKCLLAIGSTTILDHQIDNLRLNGISDITIVTGFCEELVKRHCGQHFRYISNPVFDTTNSIYSLWLALTETRGSLIVLNSDVVFHPDILKGLLDSGYCDALAVSFCNGMGDEEMKVKVSNDRVWAINKEMDPATADGENVGVLKFSPEGRDVVLTKLDGLIRAGVVKAWAPFVLNELCSSYPLYSVSTRGLPWIEIDFPADLEKARHEIYPKIHSSLTPGRT
jgi:choline kinase